MGTSPMTSDSSQPTCGINLSKDVMVPMRDGIRLATDIFRPARDNETLAGPFPTVLCRTPYDKTDKRYVEIADFFTPRGYVTVLQDLRDRYRSEGRGEYFHVANEHDARDGYDTIEWIAGRSWSNGRIGMVGSSYAGLMQTRAALEKPPHLTCIWPDVMPTNSYRHQSREGGAMQLHMFWALFMHAQDAQEIRGDEAANQKIWDGLRDMRQLLRSMPFVPGQTPLAVVPNLEKTLFDYYYRGAYDEFWQRDCNDFERYFDRHADIPGTYTSGWYDPFTAAATAYFSAMAWQNRSPQRLVIGPWAHVTMRGDVSWLGDVDFGPAAVWGVERYFAEQLRWHDRWLKDAPNGFESEPPVRIFVMGGGDGTRTPEGKLNHGGQWRCEHKWPLARTQYTKYFLHAGGDLSPETPAADVPPRRYVYDPNHPVPTLGGSLAGIMEASESSNIDQAWRRFTNPMLRLKHIVVLGPVHQREAADVFAAEEPYPPLADRADVLVFQTQTLKAPLEVTGPIVVELHISSSAVDTDFTAKLVDVYPPSSDYSEGFHMNLCDSVIRTRFRNTWEREEFMTPGEVYRVTIELPPTSNLFQAGHRIRLDISSSNFPRLDINPNTGEPMGRHTRTQPAENVVYLDAKRPSYVVLPVIPQG